MPAAANSQPGDWGEQGVAASAGQRLHMKPAPNRDLEDLMAAEDAWTMTRSADSHISRQLSSHTSRLRLIA